MSYLRRPNTGRPQLIHNNPYDHHQTTMEYKPYLLKEDNEQKIPLFLIKLWNIVEDPTYREVVRWDETGLSFHIMDPYAFCSNILPQYFKHKNLNSLVRQLNMYGFRKNTPLDRSGLNRAESDQDHLEFLHPYFRRDHPELLGNIKRKVPNKSSLTAAAIQQLQASGGDGTTVAVHTSDLSNIFDELKSLRDRQKGMEMRMEELTKENEMLWTEMAHIRGTHLKQQQIVNKLIQFLVALVAPGNKQQSRLGKRHMYVLEDGPGGSKRFRESAGGGGGGIGDLLGDGGSSSDAFGSGRSMDPSDGNSPATANNQIQSILPANASEILDRLINDITSSGGNFGSGNGAANFIYGHEQNHININNLTKHRLHRNAPTKIDPLIEDVDELRMMNTGNQHNRQQQQQLDPFLNNKQLQPYTGGGDSAARLRSASGSAGSLISTSSGPIIAEVTEDLDQFGADDISAGSGGGMFHVGGGRQQQQPQLAVVVSSPVQTNVASPGSGEQQMQQRMGDATVGQQQNNFRGYSSSFGSTGTAPASKRAATYQQQQQPMRSTMTTVVPSQAQQQHPIVIYTPMSTAGSPPQQQQQQPLVIYSPITPVGSEPVTPQHQQQQVMMLQQMPMSQQQVQIHQQPRQCPTPNSNNFSYQQQQQRRGQQQQQPMQFVTAPSSGQQPQIGIGIDQQRNNSNSPLVAQPSSIGESPQSGTGLDVPLTEGMMLNEQEMAEIAGLNAFLEKANATLDENGTRFQTLSNSIGEHWNSVGVDPDDVDFHDLDLFDYDNSIGNEHATDGGESQLHGTQTTEGARYVRSPYNNEPRNFQDHGGHPGI